jgi:hypothetical protein
MALRNKLAKRIMDKLEQDFLDPKVLVFFVESDFHFHNATYTYSRPCPIHERRGYNKPKLIIEQGYRIHARDKLSSADILPSCTRAGGRIGTDNE